MDVAGQDEPMLSRVSIFSSSSSGSDSDYKVNVTQLDDDSEDEDDATWGKELESKGRKIRKGKRSGTPGAGGKELESEGPTTSMGKMRRTPSARWMELKSKCTKSRKLIKRSAAGARCHYCRQRRVEPHVSCTYCPIKFCGRCLLNRHGEKIRDEMRNSVRWVCPRCRGGCGRGCETCCTCVKCRKTQNLEPTHQLVRAARAEGFSNVHDYLIHLETGEDAPVIARRKERRGWTSAWCIDRSIDDEAVADCAWVGKRKRNHRKDPAFDKRLKRTDLTSARPGSHVVEKKHDVVQHGPNKPVGDGLHASCIKKHETRLNDTDSKCQLTGPITFHRADETKGDENTRKSRTSSLSLSSTCEGETNGTDYGLDLSTNRGRATKVHDAVLERGLDRDQKPDGVSIYSPNTTIDTAGTLSEPPPGYSPSHCRSRKELDQRDSQFGKPNASREARIVKEKQGKKIGLAQDDCLGLDDGLPLVAVEVDVNSSTSLPFKCRTAAGHDDKKLKQRGVDSGSSRKFLKQTGVASRDETKGGNSAPKMRGSINALGSNLASKLKCAVSRITTKSRSHSQSHTPPQAQGLNDANDYSPQEVKATVRICSTQDAKCKPAVRMEDQKTDCSVGATTAASKRGNDGGVSPYQYEGQVDKSSICPILNSNSLTQEDKGKSTAELEGQQNGCSVDEMTAKSKRDNYSGSSTDRHESQIDMYSMLDLDSSGRSIAVSARPGKSCTSTCMQSNKFMEELELLFEKPFSELQLRRMWDYYTYRTPTPQLRQQGTSWEEQSMDSCTYLDHYPELTEKLIRESASIERLKLLRGFFFWLQHANMEGAYRPWVTEDEETEDKDFLDIDSEAISCLLETSSGPG